MRAFSICLSLLMLVSAGADARHRGTEPSSQTDLTGTWTGTWDGAGTGGFELTLEKGKDGKLAGQVSVTGEPTYKATLKTLKIEGQKMNASYDFPPDESAEVTLTAIFEPAIIIAVGLVVGFVAVAMVSAMYGIFGQVGI